MLFNPETLLYLYLYPFSEGLEKEKVVLLIFLLGFVLVGKETKKKAEKKKVLLKKIKKIVCRMIYLLRGEFSIIWQSIRFGGSFFLFRGDWERGRMGRDNWNEENVNLTLFK